MICGEKPGRHLVNLEKPWRRIRAAAKLDDVRLHDLRHSFASVGCIRWAEPSHHRQDARPLQPATTARYAHLADDPVRAASEAVGRHIAAAMDGRAPRLLISEGHAERGTTLDNARAASPGLPFIWLDRCVASRSGAFAATVGSPTCRAINCNTSASRPPIFGELP